MDYTLIIMQYEQDEDGDVFFIAPTNYGFIIDALKELGEVYLYEEREDELFINGEFASLDLSSLEDILDEYKFELTIVG